VFCFGVLMVDKRDVGSEGSLFVFLLHEPFTFEALHPPQ
jgi:hypothetical protein